MLKLQHLTCLNALDPLPKLGAKVTRAAGKVDGDRLWKKFFEEANLGDEEKPRKVQPMPKVVEPTKEEAYVRDAFRLSLGIVHDKISNLYWRSGKSVQAVFTDCLRRYRATYAGLPECAQRQLLVEMQKAKDIENALTGNAF